LYEWSIGKGETMDSFLGRGMFEKRVFFLFFLMIRFTRQGNTIVYIIRAKARALLGPDVQLHYKN
jgi:hypothetical protein